MPGSTGISDPTPTLPGPSDQKLPLGQQAPIGKEQFLNLLVAQLTHQDPLNPLQGTEFTAQLAQFTALEQLININETLGKLSNVEAAITQSQAVSMLGKQVLAEGNTVSVSGGVASNLTFSLAAPSDQAVISVFNEAGQLIAAIEGGKLSAGQNSIPMPTVDGNGNPVPAGVYSFKVTAVDANGADIAVQTFASGIVEGVSIKDGETRLSIGGGEIPLSSVIQIVEIKEPPPGGGI